MQLTTADCCVVEGGDFIGGELVGLWSGRSLAGLLGVREGNVDLREVAGREEARLKHLQLDALRPLNDAKSEDFTKRHSEVRVEDPRINDESPT